MTVLFTASPPPARRPSPLASPAFALPRQGPPPCLPVATTTERPFPCLTPSPPMEAEELVSTGSSAAATARVLEGCAEAPGVDGRCPSPPHMRLEEPRRPSTAAWPGRPGAQARVDAIPTSRPGNSYIAPSQPAGDALRLLELDAEGWAIWQQGALPRLYAGTPAALLRILYRW